MKMHLLLTIILTFLLSINFVWASEIAVQSDALIDKEIKAQINKIKIKRIIIANALLLTDSQKKKANEIYSKTIAKESIQLVQLRKEQATLKNMSKENTTFAERRIQRKIVNNLYDAIKKSENETDKEFKKILNHNQRVKFNRLKKEISISEF